MITWFIKPGEKQNLAWLAIVLPLAGLGFWIPGVVVLSPLLLFTNEQIGGLGGLLLSILWVWWMIALWCRAIKVVREARTKEASPKNFHGLQVFALLSFGADLLAKGGDWLMFLQWVVCMDVAVAVFYFSFFLLALLTWTKVPWHTATGFGIVLLALIFEMCHNPFHGHGF
jgi:hypothetical protein